MPYTANQYNYATPLSSAPGLFSDAANVSDKKYLSLLGNRLDGSYYPISGDVGLWGTSVSDADGILSEPFVVTVTDELTVNALRIVGSSLNYPVDFTIQLYNGDELLLNIEETGNTSAEYLYYAPSALLITSYVVTITRISSPNSVAQLYNTYNPAHIKRYDSLKLDVTGTAQMYFKLEILREDNIAIAVSDGTSKVRNTIDVTTDTLSMDIAGRSTPINIHSVMKDPSRRIYGKVYITYTDPMLSTETTVQSSGEAYNGQMLQVLDTVRSTDKRFFTLYDNDLSGGYHPSDELSQVGWVSDAVSDASGHFEVDPQLVISFSARPVVGLPIVFDASHDCVVEDFTATFVLQDGSAREYNFVGNTEQNVVITEDTIPNVVSVIITVHKVSKAGYPAAIIEVPIVSTVLYVGYQDMSNLISIDMLEELTYEDDVEALGGVSANEVTVVLDNSNSDFFFNSGSAVASQLRRNRKIVPWLGAEIIPGQIEWYTLGTYWSYNWTVPVNGLTATVVGFDTLGLLDTTSYTKHSMFVNASIGTLIESVLEDAKAGLDFIEYDIHEELYDIIIPYAWFEAGSHTAALRKISKCYPMHIYCDRQGVIKAAPQKLRLDYYYDTWSDSTNVVDKTYDSLYTTLPNIINVKVISPVAAEGKQIASDKLVFDVSVVPSRVLNFSSPYISDLSVEIDCDSSVSYTYDVYSWGIDIKFTGTGIVRTINCTGTALETSESSIMTYRNDDSIRLNGAVTRDISSDFIQDSSLAATLINRIVNLSEYDKYDAKVNYRGDIALTINDPILLQDGIAPDNRYNIKRHQLSWNGSLTGSADLNT